MNMVITMEAKKKHKFTAGWNPEKASFFIDFLRTQICAQIQGIAEYDHISIRQGIAGAAQARIGTVDAVHPSGLGAAVKFIEVSDALDVDGIIGRGIHIFKMAGAV